MKVLQRLGYCKDILKYKYFTVGETKLPYRGSLADQCPKRVRAMIQAFVTIYLREYSLRGELKGSKISDPKWKNSTSKCIYISKESLLSYINRIQMVNHENGLDIYWLRVNEHRFARLKKCSFKYDISFLLFYC